MLDVKSVFLSKSVLGTQLIIGCLEPSRTRQAIQISLEGHAGGALGH